MTRSGERETWVPAWTRNRDVRDAGLAAVVLAVDVLVFSTLGSSQPSAPTAVVLAVGALGAVVLAFRRRHPLGVFGILLLYAALVDLFVEGYSPTIGLTVALYTVAAHRRALVAGACLFAFVVVRAGGSLADEIPAAAARGESVVDTAQVILLMIALIGLAAWGVGRWARAGREAARRLRLLGEWERRQAVEEERRTIARELHDIVSHAVAVMVVQAAGAQRVVARDPQRVAAVLSEIETTGSEAMAELRRLLRTLRDTDADPATSEVDSERGVGDVDELVASVRRAGVDATLRHVGPVRPVDRSIGLAAYRVVQEALTNVTKHAGRNAHAAVELVWTRDHLEVRVTDDGGDDRPGAPALSTGTGLTGLRERAEIAGGSLDVGANGEGGFAVHARLPTHRPEQPAPALHSPAVP